MSEKLFLKCKDHTVSGRSFGLKYNKELDLLETVPKPSVKELPYYYRSEDYISHTDSKRSLLDKAYQFVKGYMLDKKLEWIEEEKMGKGKLLDIGAGTGDFLLKARSRGWEAFGAEPNHKARELAAQKEIELKTDTSSFPDKFFDVITMWHVLEHVPDLDSQINELQRLLKDDGLLVIAVPNFRSYDARKYKQHWAAFDVPRHLWHFSQKAISKIFYGFEMEVKKTQALPFDSFYVSLLSEKHRSGKATGFLKGLFSGLVSNLKAGQSGEYSSLAYFLKNQQKMGNKAI